MNNYHATPFDQSALGFYFDDFEDYQTKAENHTNEYGDLIEEVELCLERHSSYYVGCLTMSCRMNSITNSPYISGLSL